MRKLLGRNAAAGVADTYAEPVWRGGFAAQRHRPTGAVILHGIAQQVEQDLLEPLAVGDHVLAAPCRLLAAQVDPLLGRERLDEVADLVNDLTDVDRLGRELEAPGLDAGNIQNLIDEVKQVVSGLEDLIDALLPFFIKLFHLKELSKAEDGIQRRTKLVAHAGEELALGPVRFLCLPLRSLGLVFGLLKNLGGGHPRADIADDADDQEIALGAHRAEADLDRELAAVLAAPIQLEPHAHRPGTRRGGIGRAVVDMYLAEPFGQQDLKRRAEELVPRVPEALLGLTVDEHDTAGAVDDDDRVRSRFEQPLEPGLGRLGIDGLAVLSWVHRGSLVPTVIPASE